jgi:hypothetical protein
VSIEKESASVIFLFMEILLWMRRLIQVRWLFEREKLGVQRLLRRRVAPGVDVSLNAPEM